MSNPLTRLFKEPLFQFLIIGGVIYGAYALFAAPEPCKSAIRTPKAV